MLAITFALPNESSEFVRLLDTRGIRDEEVAVLHTGVGEKTCRARIEPFLDSRRFDLLISSGFAGGADPSLGVGNLLLAENFSDPQLLAKARALLVSRVGRLATAGRVIESAGDRARLAREDGAAAMDMETEWIARACAARKIPMLSLRVISDTAAAPFPVPPAVLFDLERQKTDAFKLVAYLFRHPSQVVGLTRFARQIAAVRATLGAALYELVAAL
jgi:adenosylhomocysteine nucleosidase